MNYLCISTSNIEPFRCHSASTRVCQLISEIIGDRAQTETLALIDYELNPCRMCAACRDTDLCVRDPAFNRVYQKMQSADGIFIIVPHYAPFPSKLMMLCEKLQEMAFLNSCRNPQYHTLLFAKPLGIIAHGGQEEKALRYYQEALVIPIANALTGVQMKVVGAGEEWPQGVAFGIESLRMPEGAVFCEIRHNWDSIRQRITPLVDNMLKTSVV